jgi:hypothetical protein
LCARNTGAPSARKVALPRALLAAAALAVFAPRSHAGEAAVRLHVRPAPAPQPALKYQLLPEVRELNPGNPAQYYLRCFAEQRFFFFSKEGVAERTRYLTMPLAKLRAENRQGYGGSALKQADWAARLDALDWFVLQRVQTEGLGLALPELGPLRVLGEALQARFRIDVAGRRFDDAVRDAKTMFALARHLGEHPTGAANRVGLRIAGRALDTLEEMVQQPGCPNFYWALTDLPRPLVDLRKGVQGDRALAAGELRRLRDDSPMTADELEKVIGRLSGRMGFAREQAGRAPRSLRAALRERVNNPARVHAARCRLAMAAWAAAGTAGQPVYQGLERVLRVWTFPATQVILLDEKHAYEVRRDEELKLLALAPWQIDALARGAGAGRGGNGLFADLLPDAVPLRRAQARLEQRLALLRHVEALRLYAAGHGGRLPTRLADCPVPLPDDPFTGKPFRYRSDGNTAHLHGGPRRGEGKDRTYNVHYEVTFCPSRARSAAE